MKDTTHKQITILINNKEIEVDNLIANSIIKLNRLGYHTIYCCSGHCTNNRVKLHADYGYIAFKYRKTPYYYNLTRPNDDKINGISFHWFKLDKCRGKSNNKMDNVSLQFKIENPTIEKIIIANDLLYNWICTLKPPKYQLC